MRNVTCKTIFSLFLALALTACMKTHTAPVNMPDDTATTKLAEAASSISQSLTDLNAIEKASKPPINDKVLAYPTGADMDQTASIDWTGPIEPLLSRVADNCGYKLRVIGARPAIPVLVTISAKNTPIAYIIRDANFQAGSRASVLVYPAVRIIELRYAKA
jgi:defect in organelle trafficking protein DotD